MRPNIYFLAFGLIICQLLSLTYNLLGPTLSNIVESSAFCFKEFRTPQHNPDIHLSIDQFITKYGYPVQKYKVTTEDGYILTVFRIPESRKSPIVSNVTKKAVYLNHGLGGNGQAWILHHGDRNLGFKLVDAGFDVFLSNCRGNSYSQGHVNLTTSDSAYWDFSWNEMGIHDVPAVMDLITNVTGNEKMYYVGHSMGTTQYFIAMSERPELNDRILTGFMLAPIAYVSRSTSVFHLLAHLTYNSGYLINPGGKVQIAHQIKEYTGSSVAQLCTASGLACAFCTNLVFMTFGFDILQTNYTNVGLQLSVYPGTVSTKSLVHFAQSMVSSQFRKFDYGNSKANEAKYGKGITSPPAYDLSLITAPTVFINGLNDNLGVPADAQLTASKLRSSTLKQFTTVDWALFNHMDFAVAIDADKLLYNNITATMVNAVYDPQ